MSNTINAKRVLSLDELEALYPQPAETSLAKELPCLNQHYRQLIKASPFVLIASVSSQGMDCSPRGDSPGFVYISDDETLVIPDRKGNNRLDTLKNIICDPRIALLFIIPGINETLRVNGTAYISQDDELLKLFEVNGNLPTTAIVIDIERVYFQCARALKRSQLWDSSQHANSSELPSPGTLIKSAIEDFDAAAYDADLQDRQARTLY